MKKVLVISPCGKRRDTIGLIGSLLSSLKGLDKEKYHISLLDTNFFENNHNPNDYEVDNYYCLDKNWIDGIIRKIPRARSKYADYLAVKTFKRLVRGNGYDVIIVYQIPIYADKLVTIAHLNGAKIVFEPFGSDILRASDVGEKRLMNAFAQVDAVCGRDKSGTINAAKEIYKVPEKKIRVQKLYSEGVRRLMDLKGKYTRKELSKSIGIPQAEYNIVCGYSGRQTHRHNTIIDALINVKDILPNNYQIIFPMTYGAGDHHEIVLQYAAQLKEICDNNGLNSVFLTDFMTTEQVSFLHLVTDLFIEIQPTDNGNAFMIEALFAENQIVTGSWLKYDRFEQFGIPYYLINDPTELSSMLNKIFNKQIEQVKVPQALIDYFKVPEDLDRSKFWSELFDTI